MDPREFSGDKSSPMRKELQGPRPTPLKVNKDSHKIRKPPPAATTTTESRKPVIIFAVSPKVIHTTVDDYKNLVQRLTGSSSTTTSTTGGDISPAARLASIEKASPSGREKEREKAAADLMGIVEEGVVEVGQMMPGILSPAPSSLPVIPPGFFSPGSDPQSLSLLYDLSPFRHGNNNNNMFIPSPSTLFSAPLISPSLSAFDLFDLF